MNAEFWHEKWRNNEIGFHETAVNPLLVSHLDTLKLAPGSRVFVPMCGKTLDIAWLLGKGYKVAAVELVESAIEQLFDELGVQPVVTPVGNLKLYAAPNLDVYVGDVYALSRDTLRPVDAVYDRAALIALPEPMRQRYTRHLTNISARAPQLLISLAYDQSHMAGPPFSVNNKEVRLHYEGAYDMTLLHSKPITGGLKGKVDAVENVWRLLSRE
ncbi:MAG: Thiopurine S-methyltransferase [Pseudomonadota bacterium]|jgi:thiopurine S-methyltransferase